METLGTIALPHGAGRPIRVSSDGRPEWLPIGATIAWSKIAAAGSDTTLEDGTPVKAGQKYIRYGTVLVPIRTQEVQTVDLSNAADPTSGTWSLTINPALGDPATLTGIAFDVSAATLQAALRLLHIPHAAGMSVSKSGFVYTITYPYDASNPAVAIADVGTLAGSGAVTIGVATTTPGDAAGGEYAPYDSSASDGRQTLTRSEVGIVDETIVNWEKYSNLTGLIVGGNVYRQRLLVDTGTAPSLSNLLTALPRLGLSPLE